ncbi:MAG: energy transducer TonB, partial [Acidobacteriota bacterium]
MVVDASGGRVELVRRNDAGEFAFPAVPKDEYMVVVEKAGFGVLTNASIELGGPGGGAGVYLERGGKREAAPQAATAPLPPMRLRVGGNVQSAKLVSKVSPVYPPDCKREGVSGIVLLNAVIGKDGSVASLEPANEFLDARLREAAMSAVKLWRYQTTLLNGIPVAGATAIEVNFTLLP